MLSFHDPGPGLLVRACCCMLLSGAAADPGSSSIWCSTPQCKPAVASGAQAQDLLMTPAALWGEAEHQYHVVRVLGVRGQQGAEQAGGRTRLHAEWSTRLDYTVC